MIVRRNSQPPIRSDDLSNRFRREIVLPHMHAIELGSQTQISPIIHDQPNKWRVPHFSLILGEVGILIQGSEELSQFPSLLQHHPRIARFITVLQKSTSAGSKFSRKGDQFRS